MEESKQKLQDALRDLHGALETADDLDESDRGELTSAIEEIRAVLGDPDAGSESDSLRGRLRAAVERFEDRHPELTKMIGRVADSLSDMGI
ncbi:MAG: DUF4404 family protein [Deltaproteobacteria bacterium]|nr:DUF4404 family protein [Deltaproteobacteria bacterium]